MSHNSVPNSCCHRQTGNHLLKPVPFHSVWPYRLQVRLRSQSFLLNLMGQATPSDLDESHQCHHQSHQCLDHIQCGRFIPTESGDIVQVPGSCLDAERGWMKSNQLRLNFNKSDIQVASFGKISSDTLWIFNTMSGVSNK